MIILRTFKILERQALRLANRAGSMDIEQGQLVRNYIDAYLSNPEMPSSSPSEDKKVLRSFYLTVEQDNKLQELADKNQVSKGFLFRQAIDKGLGTP
jgi:hypothetical protein